MKFSESSESLRRSSIMIWLELSQIHDYAKGMLYPCPGDRGSPNNAMHPSRRSRWFPMVRLPRRLRDRQRSGTRQRVKKFSIRTLIFLIAVVAVLLCLAQMPRKVSVNFPMDRREYVRDLYGTEGVYGKLNHFSANNVSTFTGSPGWSIWFSEKTILHDAKTQDYFCIIDYQSVLGNSWKRSFVNGKCGHNRIYTNCLDCQSVSRP
jgi:hypothetical protein